MESSKKNSAPALQRGLYILEALAKSRGGLTLSQLTRDLQLPKSSVYCLLRTLEDSGYVNRDPESAKNRASLRICWLAHMALGGISLREHARPHLRRLATSTGLTVHIALLDCGACVLIDKVAPEPIRVATWVGKHLSFHCTALGKALAAHLPPNQVDAMIREQGLLRHNDNTICSPKRLKQDLADVRRRGYALDDEEEEIGMRCIGAPVFNSVKQAVAAVSVVGSTEQVHSGILERLAAQVVDTANSISMTIKSGGEQSETTTAQWSTDARTR